MKSLSIFRGAAYAAGTICLLAAAPALALTATDVPKTQVASAAALQTLVHNTGVTLQWNWGAQPGPVTVEAKEGQLALRGRQQDAHGGVLDIDGAVTRIDEKMFMFKGRIFLHDAEANVDCTRDGEYTFRITGARKFWRLKEQEAHCDGRADLTDYVDIHFK